MSLLPSYLVAFPVCYLLCYHQQQYFGSEFSNEKLKWIGELKNIFSKYFFNDFDVESCGDSDNFVIFKLLKCSGTVS